LMVPNSSCSSRKCRRSRRIIVFKRCKTCCTWRDLQC
jgi:hypothetical protein